MPGLGAALIGASVVLGAVAAYLASGNAPALALLLPLLLVPVLLWKQPRVAVYLLFAAAVTVEQFGYEVGPRGGAATSKIPFFQGILPAGANPAEVLLMLGLVIVVMQAVQRRERWFQKTATAGLLAAMVALVAGYFVIGLSRGGDPTSALWEVRPFVYLLGSYVLAAALIDSLRNVRPLLWILVIGSGVKAVYGLSIFLSVRHVEPRPEAVLAHEESFFFGLFIFATTALWLFGVRERVRIVATALLPVVLACDMVNSRRTAWLILGAGIAVLLVVAIVRLPERRRKLLALAGVLILGTALYLPAFWSSTSTLAQPARAVRSAVAPNARDDNSNAYREVETYNLMQYISQSHSMGMGFGQPLVYRGVVDLTESNPLLAYVPHNGVLYVWLRTGMAGIALLVLLVSQSVISAVRLSAARRREVAAVGAFVGAALFGYVAMGKTDMGFFWFRNAIAMGILLGVVDGLSRRHLRQRGTQADSFPAGASGATDDSHLQLSRTRS